MSCWDTKFEIFIERRLQEAEEKHGVKPLEIKDGYSYRRDGTISSYNVESERKKPAEGYQPAVKIDGPEAGRIVYVKLYSTKSRTLTPTLARMKTRVKRNVIAYIALVASIGGGRWV